MEDIINKLNKRYDKSYMWILIFTVITFTKGFTVQILMGAVDKSLWSMGINLFLIFGIYTVALALPDRWRVKGLFLIYGFLSTVIFADMVHFRYFRIPISVYSIYSANQIGAVAESIKTLINIKDIFLFIDIPILAYILWIKKVVIKRSIRYERIVAFITSILIIFSIPYLNGVKIDGNIYTVNQLGLINYHVYDIVQFFKQDDVDAVSMQNHLNKKSGNKKKVEDLKAYGIARGRNVFVIQVEALQNFVINREIEGKPITPVLNSLINNDSFYFNKYFQQLGRGNTSDAEFVSHTSLYPSMRSFSYKEYEGVDLYTLPNTLKANGYSTIAFHGNDPEFWNRKNAYPAQGLDQFLSIDELSSDELIGLGISDSSVFRQSIEYYKQLKQPFYSFFVTLTSHHPFAISENLKGLKIEGEYKGTMLGNYLESINYFDRALGEFIEELKKEGFYDNSIIVIYGDHFGMDVNNEESKLNMDTLLNREYRLDDMMNVPLIVHIPGMGNAESFDIAGGQLDFFPTIANLLGVELKREVLGQDLLNSDKGFVAQQTYMVKGSFIDNEKVFEMSRDGKFENSKAWHLYTGQPVDLELCREGYEKAIQEIDLSSYLVNSYIK